MTRTKFLAAAAVLSAMIATPVLAQDVSHVSVDQQRADHYRAYNSNYVRHDNGFWPADVTAGVVGGAVGAAGAIATAPFRDNDYAWDRSYDDRYAYNDAYAFDNGDRYYMNDGQKASSGGGRYSNSYDYSARNGFVCQPGSLVRMEDGAEHICQ